MSWFGILGKREKGAATEAGGMNPDVKSEEDLLVINASLLMSSRRYKESLEVFLLLAERYADRKGLYLIQAGTNYYFLEEFEKAIECYLAARENGADSSMIDDNIWNAVYGLYSETRDKNYLRRYLQLCPQGAYAKRVNKLV